MRMANQLPDLDPGTVLHRGVVEVDLEPVPDDDGRTGKGQDVLHSASLPVAEAVEETAEDAAFASKRGTRLRRDGSLPGDGLVVIGTGNGVDDLRLVEVLGAFDLRHVSDQHAVEHDLRLEARRAVGVPLGVAAAGQRDTDAELVDTAAEQVRVDAAVTKGVDHPASPEFVHARTVACVPLSLLSV